MNGGDALSGVVAFASQHPVALGVVLVAVVVLWSARRSHRRATRALTRVRPAVSTVLGSTVVTALGRVSKVIMGAIG